jgi:hypothetical protein
LIIFCHQPYSKIFGSKIVFIINGSLPLKI